MLATLKITFLVLVGQNMVEKYIVVQKIFGLNMVRQNVFGQKSDNKYPDEMCMVK
jgi:hypothetical protein